jgi:ABC-type transport system involved in cytochrome bd biosynthesis fused ATPase/permease subunit
MTRYWMRLEPRVWRHAFRLRLHKLLRAWGFYIGALVLVVLIAWSLNFLHQRSQDALDPLLRAAVRQNLQEQWKSLTPEQKEQYRKQAEQMNLSAEEKEAAKALLGK